MLQVNVYADFDNGFAQLELCTAILKFKGFQYRKK
jgi:hypothetical protein